MTTKTAVLSSLILLAVACASEPPKPPAAVEVGGADANAGAIATTDAASSTPTPAASGAPTASAAAEKSPFPPSGRYQVTANVISDDCQKKYKPPSPWEVPVQAGAEKKSDGTWYAKVNIPLSAVPPSNATGFSARSDLVVEPKKPPHKAVTTPLPQCSSYQVTRTMEVKDATNAGFTVAMTIEHGDSMKCSTIQPNKCTTKIEQVFKVVENVCAAECTRGLTFHQGDGGASKIEADCRCP